MTATRSMQLFTCGALLLILSGCEPQAENQSGARTARHALSVATIDAALGASDQLLDVRADGALLVGVVQPALPNSDAPRVLKIALIKSGARSALPVSLVMDARFRPGSDAILAITPDHLLVQIEQGTTRTLAERAQPPMALSPGGAYLAYAHGEEPFYKITRRALDGGEGVLVSGDHIACWSPAVGDDGVVYFASSKTGYGELYRAVDGREPERLTDRQGGEAIAIPAGPSAPHVPGVGLLFFEDPTGVHALRVGEERVVEVEHHQNARLPVWPIGRKHALARQSGETIEISLDVKKEVAR